MTPKTITIRQGDVALLQVASLPAGCTLVEGQEKKIILAWGEVTGHHHRIEDHVRSASESVAEVDAALQLGLESISAGRSHEIADAAIERARVKARLWKAPNGETFLEVLQPVTLRHEEHTAHEIPPGIYKQPTQVEYTPAELRRVAD